MAENYGSEISVRWVPNFNFKNFYQKSWSVCADDLGGISIHMLAARQYNKWVVGKKSLFCPLK